MDKLEEIVEKVLIGIDLTEIESENGWWETSVGAEFGKKKKLELIKALKRHLTSAMHNEQELKKLNKE